MKTKKAAGIIFIFLKHHINISHISNTSSSKIKQDVKHVFYFFFNIFFILFMHLYQFMLFVATVVAYNYVFNCSTEDPSKTNTTTTTIKLILKNNF